MRNPELMGLSERSGRASVIEPSAKRCSNRKVSQVVKAMPDPDYRERQPIQ
jgi:hypothetical protein